MKTIERIKVEYGKVPLCNGKKHRGIIIRGFCLPLCTRCSCIVLGLTVGLVPLSFLKEKLMVYGFFKLLLIGLFLQIPMYIDGALQYRLNIESTNIRRAITGFISGIGICFVSLSITSSWDIIYF